MTATIDQPTGAPPGGPLGGPLGGHAVDERSLRIPNISADLLPVEITAARRTRKVRRTVIASLTAFAVALAAWYGMAFQETRTASTDLDRAQDRVRVLNSKQHGFTELVQVQKDAKTINDQLSSLMAKDLQWSRLLQSLQSAAPTGITITGVTAALTTDQTAGGPNAKSGIDSTDAIGTLTLGGVGTSKNVIAAYVDALAKVKGVANALPGDVTQQSSGLQFSVHMDITKAALGGRFTKTTGTGTK
jgi:Tfp pilus assembly protein PilN